MILIGEIHVVGHIEYYDEIDGKYVWIYYVLHNFRHVEKNKNNVMFTYI